MREVRCEMWGERGDKNTSEGQFKMRKKTF